jgi:hypothetical protein
MEVIKTETMAAVKTQTKIQQPVDDKKAPDEKKAAGDEKKPEEKDPKRTKVGREESKKDPEKK